MGKHTYEIYKRDTNEHRAGHWSFRIDGHESEVTCDPAPYLAKALRIATEEGLDPQAAAVRAMELADEYAQHAMERIIQRLQEGRLLPGGVPMGPSGELLASAVPRVAHSKRRANESHAVNAFLNRGVLRGLTPDDRKRRRDRINERQDHETEWRQRRLELIAVRESELREIETLIRDGKAPRLNRLEADAAKLRDEIRALKAPVLAASHGFQYAYGQYWQGAINMVSDDIRIVPLMTNTTVDTERDAKDQVSDFTTLDEFDGANYSSGGNALGNQAVNIDDANDRAEFDADDVTRTALGAGTRAILGELIIKFVTNLNSSVPLHWTEYASTKTPDGSNFVVQMNAEGILQMIDG